MSNDEELLEAKAVDELVKVFDQGLAIELVAVLSKSP